MTNRYSCNPRELSQARVTFWCYAVSIPIIIFLFLLPVLRGGTIAFSPITLVYPLIVLFLIYQAYRSLRVLLSTKNTYCETDGERIRGLSIPTPFRRAEPFDIAKSEILGIAKTGVAIGRMRSFEALVLNLQSKQLVLFALDRIDELKKELEQ